MSPPVTFTWAPGPRDGSWAVTLPGDASIGELIVYAEAAAPPGPGTGYRWKCDESALPLLEASGFNHQLITGGSTGGVPELSRTSMRADGTGHAFTEGSGHDMYSLWSPAIPVGSVTTFAIAGLIGNDTGIAGASYAQLALTGIMGINRPVISFALQDPEFIVWAGTGWALAATAATSPSTGHPFVAFRVAAGGAFSYWWGDLSPTSGTLTGWSPEASTAVQAYINDVRSFKMQEIHVWLGPVTDADIAAVRLDLIGV